MDEKGLRVMTLQGVLNSLKDVGRDFVDPAARAVTCTSFPRHQRFMPLLPWVKHEKPAALWSVKIEDHALNTQAMNLAKFTLCIKSSIPGSNYIARPAFSRLPIYAQLTTHAIRKFVSICSTAL